MIRPHSIFIVLTTDCDKRGECAYCFYNIEPERRVPSRLDLKTINGLFKQFALLNIRNIYLTGGEPLLREDLEEIIACARELGLNTFLLSNGRTLDISRARRLESAGLDVFVMSLNGLEIVDRKSISAVSRFKRTSLSFIYVLTKGNLGYIQDIIELARALEAGLIFQPAYIPENHSLRKKMSIGNLGAFDWPKLYTELREWAVMLGYERYLDLIYDSYHDRKLRPESCVMGTGAVVIDADGSVYPCFHRRELECGNIFRDELAEILHKSEKFSSELSKAQCFGEHCVSLHTHYGK